MIWKSLLWIAHESYWVVFVLVVVTPFTGNRRSARVLDGRIELGPSRIDLYTWPMLGAYLFFAAMNRLKHSLGKPLDFVTAASLGLLAFMFLFSSPGKIVITDDGLQQIYWFRRNKRIQWDEIVEIRTSKKGEVVTIVSADGTKIVHSPQLADGPLLLQEIKRYCSDNLPPDFLDESIPK